MPVPAIDYRVALELIPIIRCWHDGLIIAVSGFSAFSPHALAHQRLVVGLLRLGCYAADQSQQHHCKYLFHRFYYLRVKHVANSIIILGRNASPLHENVSPVTPPPAWRKVRKIFLVGERIGGAGFWVQRYYGWLLKSKFLTVSSEHNKQLINSELQKSRGYQNVKNDPS